MDNNNCVILKRKEYDDLTKLANSKKLDKIYIEIIKGDKFESRNVWGTIDLSINLRSQIYRIINLMKNQSKKELKYELNKQHAYIHEKIANMSWWKRRKYLKQYESK